MRTARHAVASTIAACALLISTAAFAQEESNGKLPPLKQQAAPAATEVSGVVVSIDEEDIVVDLGSARGAADGSSIELWRPFRLRHPVTGQMLSDRFRIGTLRLVQVQKTLALARPEGKLSRAAAPGDVVILSAPIPAPIQTAKEPSPLAPFPSAAPAPTDRTAEPLDAEARELSAIFESLKGQGINARIQRYEQHATAHPMGKYTRVLMEEANALRRLQAGPRPEEPAPPKPHPVFVPPQSALANQALALGVESLGSNGAVLHVRHAGEVAYQSIPMRAAGNGYFRATIPGSQVKSPELSYFVESTNPSGAASPLVAFAESPLTIEVHDAPRPEAPASPDASVAMFTDYANYNRMRANDYAWQTEGYFGLRYGDFGVRAVRSGFGVYRGVGGSIQDLDQLGIKGRKVGLTYGYLEGEFATNNFVGLIGRIILGLTDEGVDGGGQFFVRLGNDKLTNILLGGEVLGGIGLKGIAELQWNTIARMPIVIRTEVTNQPAGSLSSASSPTSSSSDTLTDGDVGARAMLQIGYRVVPSLTLSLRGSYEGRTIQHAGPGAGAGVSYTW
jgi:hypothetical protein